MTIMEKCILLLLFSLIILLQLLLNLGICVFREYKVNKRTFLSVEQYLNQEIGVIEFVMLGHKIIAKHYWNYTVK